VSSDDDEIALGFGNFRLGGTVDVPSAKRAADAELGRASSHEIAQATL
jgi:hypothetical protein